MRQAIEAVINHLQGVAQIILAVFSPGQIGKICRETGRICRPIILIKGNAVNGIKEFCFHFVCCPESEHSINLARYLQAALAWAQARSSSSRLPDAFGGANSKKGKAR